jgi:glycosyltransferase involved in cell wall biosynthesis
MFVRDFPDLARSLGVTYDVTLHDFTPICPRIHAIDYRGRYCGLPRDPSACDRCVGRAGRLTVTPSRVAEWRQANERILRAAVSIVAPSNDTVERYARVWPGLAIRCTPHEPDRAPPAAARRPRGCGASEPVRVAVAGSIHRMKGADVLLEAAADASRRKLPVRYSVIGSSIYDRKLRRLGVTVTGRYDRARLPALLTEAGVHLVWLPSIWPETYCYVLSEIWEAGYYAVVFDTGAPAERIRKHGAGSILPIEWLDEPARVNEHFLSLRSAR